MKPRRPIRRLLLWTVGLLLFGFVLLQLWYFIQVWQLRDHNPASTAFMRERLAVLSGIDPHAHVDYHYVPYNRIATVAKKAVVASEDDRFMQHWGFDFKGIKHAMEENIDEGQIVAGGSTISQQLAKNLFLSSERSFWRKGEEAIITVMLEGVLGKKRILDLYLNVVEWGNMIYGIEAASEHYYHKHASQLTRHEAAHLAAMLPNPRFYQDNPGSRGLQRRVQAVEGRMEYSQIPQ